MNTYEKMMIKELRKLNDFINNRVVFRGHSINSLVVIQNYIPVLIANTTGCNENRIKRLTLQKTIQQVRILTYRLESLC